MLIALYVAAAAAILLRAVVGIGSMELGTCHTIRVAAIVMATGALAAMLSTCYGHQPGWWDVLVLSGVAAYVWRDRRRVLEP